MGGQVDYAGLLHPIFSKDIIEYSGPAACVISKDYPLSEDSHKVGKYFEEMVTLGLPQGFSLNGSAGTLVDLNDPVAGLSLAAEIYPFAINLREQIPYEFFDRSGNGGAKAVKSAGAYIAQVMADSHLMTQEALHINGQTGVFTVSSLSSQVITINDDSWSPAMAKCLLKKKIEVYQSDLATPRATGLQVTSIDFANKKLTVTGTTTGIVSTDVIFLKGGNSSGTFKEEVGLIKQISNLTDSIFAIDKGDYPIWQGNVVTSAGAFSKTALIQWCKRANAKGFAGPLTAYIPSKAYGVLLGHELAMRVFDSSYSSKKSMVGVDKMEMSLGMDTSLTIKEAPLMGEGRVLVLPSEDVKTVGSRKISFEVPGRDGEIFKEAVIGKNGLEFQSNSDLQIFCRKPEGAVYISGITYT
jgi:hypothetical protein